MTKLLIRGLDGEGPGDIVGAFVNEADLDPNAIGAIEIDEGRATVEVTSEEAAGDVVEALDGGRVGRSRVSIVRLDEKTRQVHQYAETYRALVQLEREEEMRRHEEEIRALSGRERESRGRAFLDMRGRDEGETLSGHMVKFMRSRKGRPLGDTEIGVGDLVMISRNDPHRDDNPTGTVARVTNYSLTVAFEEKPLEFVFGSGLRVDLYVNDITFQRMLEAIDALVEGDEAPGKLRNIITGIETPRSPERLSLSAWHNAALNESQQEAVRGAVNADSFHLIHGPPGTGKTTTAIEVIEQCIGRDETVLATAASNTAVDNMVEFLVDRGVDVLRLGHPVRVTPTLHEHTLDYQIQDDPRYEESRKLRERAFELKEQQEDLTHPSGRWRRGMANEKIKKLAREDRGSRGVPADRIREMARWIEIQEKADGLFERSEERKQEAIAALVRRAEVVCTTNSTAGSRLLEDQIFDTLVIDEATQATEPSCLIPIIHARRVIMAGDHRQLPPTVKDEEAARRGLSRSLFEKLAERHGDLRDLLEVQYRMHETIMDFSSRAFYEDAVHAAPSVRTHTLRDLGIQESAFSEEWRPTLAPEAPLVFVNTAGIDAPERQRADSPSRENPREAELVVHLTRELLAAGLPAEDIAVISPYDDQVDRLRRELDPDHLEVDTVDGFQGREKESVLVSLVRSNNTNTVGFLADVRRFNVAITRAKRKLVVVGDLTTVGSEAVYDQFARYAETYGRKIDL